MELKILQETKTLLVFELAKETHTFCNMLKNELQQIKGVITATYRIDHPLVGVPRFHLETSKIEPRKALQEALAAVKKKAKEFQKEVGKL